MGWAIPALLCCLGADAAPMTLQVPSTVDGVMQPCYFVPSDAEGPQPLLVFLHTWSNGYNTFDWAAWRQEAQARGWHVVVPHFRGPNDKPEACASREARQDILDAVRYVCAHYPVDENRIYLAGASGGGHMTLVMAAEAPEVWAAASAWCGISDLAAWHRESLAAKRKYYLDVEKVVGGAPGASAEVDAQLRFRSPVFHLAQAKDLPVDINAGIHDGHTGSVPVHHTLDAFNVLARAWGALEVTPEEIGRLTAEQPLASDEEQDATYGRTVYLRRYAGPSRVTIFEGGHEGIAGAACAWLAKHARHAAPAASGPGL